jgi:hypothetical protein
MKVCALVAVILIAGATGVATGNGAKPPRHCATSGRTVAKSRQVRVFRIGDSGSYSAYACVLPTGRIRHLGNFEDDGGGEWDGVYGFVVAGRFVAYEDALCDRTSCTGSLNVLDVASRQMVHRARIPVAAGPVFVIRLNGRGSVAWTRTNSGVWKCDRPKCVLLDRSNALLPNSLSLHGHTLRWKHDDGTSYSARLM